MKIIFLNVWHGHQTVELNQFLLAEADSTDIFCFQESYNEFNAHFQKLLPNFKPWTATKNVNPHDNFSQTIYIKNNINVLGNDNILEQDPDCGLGIYVEIERDNQRFIICNFHGFSLPGDKFDTPARIRQSKTLIDTFIRYEMPVIIGGDFNLRPDTNSVRLFENSGYNNLIREHSITTTRNAIAWEHHPNARQLFSDYVFVNKEAKIKTFEVINNNVSDHLPMVLTTQ